MKARSGNPGYITGLPKPQVPNSFLAPYMFKIFQVEAVEAVCQFCQGRYSWLIVPWWMGAATTGDAEMPRFQEFCLEAVPRLGFGETGPMRPMY